jgi:RimJ/RimL family protein N-acetyltransferase
VPLSHPDPALFDGSVALRRWSLDDVPELVRCCNDAEIRRWLPTIRVPYTEQDAAEFIAMTGRDDDDKLAFAIVDPGQGSAPAGSIGLRMLEPGVAQTGYWVAREARGRGIAGAALRLLSRWALADVELARLQLFADVDNPASMRVAERAGFTREGLLRNWYDLRGERRDAVMFSMLPGDVG